MREHSEVVFDDTSVKEFIKNNLSKIGKIKKELAGIIGSVIYKDVIDHFKNQSGPDGPWQAWSDSYRSYMQSLGKRGGNKILQDSGRLRQSFKPMNYRTIKDGILWYNDAKTKSGFPYAYAHNEGGPKLPQRQFMYLSKPSLDEMIKQILAYLGK